MLRGGKAVCCRDVIDPFPELALVDLDDSVTVSADEVVVMSVAAQPVAEFAAVVSKRVDDVVLPENGEGAVDGR